MVPSYLQVAAQLREEGDRRAGLEVGVKILLKLGRHHTSEVCEDAGSDVDLTQHIHLEKISNNYYMFHNRPVPIGTTNHLSQNATLTVVFKSSVVRQKSAHRKMKNGTPYCLMDLTDMLKSF